MAMGDHIFVKRDFYTHHGIDCGDGTVIQYGGTIADAGGNMVRRVPLEEFLKGGHLEVRAYQGDVNPPDVVVARAMSRLGEKDYSLWANNCEHFASWCKVSKHESDQVSWYEGIGWKCGGLLLAAGAVTILATVAVSAAQEAKKNKYEPDQA